jgi:hypothetical protein
MEISMLKLSAQLALRWVLGVAAVAAAGCEVRTHSQVTYVVATWPKAKPDVAWDVCKAVLGSPVVVDAGSRSQRIEATFQVDGKNVMVTVRWDSEEDASYISFAENWNDGDVEAIRARDLVNEELKARGIARKEPEGS